ncbi:AraC family transcriptional regulator [Streptomyces sp. NBC_01754]|uniref:helix-turn-helix transcriptional regulator n=1 Tax=Streptomyces sp. NBC_01754 TaxID=2975930 RepID=UPI002DD7AA34|nr:AraC family transcriptional regulator [Streptomyces sp. NBC_01754]WSC90927.1 AraC family transcriptional regulator [Streptomyces sp. NBC_01754]WSC96579.1 AraC family transcriptional regulator [Streptomyces sp. NBC_01754]
MSTISVEHAVRLVIDEMHLHLGQDLTLDDMARTAMFSKFHFTRVFREVTGTSPRRFLSALRIQEAKYLLVNTEKSVADISSQVGYSSVGTFSSRFKSCVGVSPSRFRELGGNGTDLSTDAPLAAGTGHPVSLRGRIVLPGDRALGQVFVGLFAGSIPQGRPVCHTLMDGPGPFELQGVPPGTWYVLAHSVPYGTQAPAGCVRGGPDVLSVGRYGPVSVHPGVLVMPADIVLHPVGPLDPPVLIALPGSGTGAGVPVAA